MAKQPDEVVLEFLQRELGDDLTGVCRFTDDNCETLFVRDDDSRVRSRHRLLERCERVLPTLTASAVDDLQASPKGETESVIAIGGNGMVMVLYRTGTDGIVVSMARTTDLHLPTFVEDCLSKLRNS